MKSPKKLRQDILDLSTHLSQVQVGLESRSSIKVAKIGKECARTAKALGELLERERVPDVYKVAVVGRFKAGKSSFVNELLGNQLASEGTLPETAAVTTFRHGLNIRASIRFLDKAAWESLKAIYAETPKYVHAHRVQSWVGFATPKKSKDGEPEKVFDLAALEQEYVREENHSLVLELPANATEKEIKEFRRKLKEFTSATSPLHCLVDKIDMEAPADILDEGVELIDTPGLDDTEQFRVTLTERVVADVDAVLFLTKSGASYGQSEKQFLLSLLRKGTVKQLIVVVTQIDETYKKVLAEAEDNDEDPAPIAQCIQRERNRIRQEIDSTLKDLEQGDSLDRYQEQLGNIQIAFTSARLHRDWKKRKDLPFEIEAADPGGVETLRGDLLKLLSTESRLTQTVQNIIQGASDHLLDLQGVLISKFKALKSTENKEVAERKLATFRQEFGQAGERFTGLVEQQITVLNERLNKQDLLDETLLENIGLLAERALGAFESDDMGRHWRTRRNGGWGYMQGLQANVANQVFPKVQQLLGERSQSFAEYSTQFEVALSCLSNDSDRIARNQQLGGAVPLDVSGKLKTVLNRSLLRAQTMIAAEEQKVLKVLDDFVTEEVGERIAEKRLKVADIWGTGTTMNQNVDIRAFYRETKQLLKDALLAHLKKRSNKFSAFLLSEAKDAPKEALNEVQILLEQAADNILAATAEHLAEEKEEALTHTTEVCAMLEQTLQRMRSVVSVIGLAADNTVPVLTQNLLPGADVLDTPKRDYLAEPAKNWPAQVQAEATIHVARMQLQDNETGWAYDRLFPPQFLRGALHLSLVDPYLAGAHQLRNLKEFLLHIAETIKPKTIEVITHAAPQERAEQWGKAWSDLEKALFSDFGIALVIRHEASLHDRFLRLDHGVLFKLGRGLDVYKPATALAVYRPAYRRVRATEMDVFAVPGNALAASAS